MRRPVFKRKRSPGTHHRDGVSLIELMAVIFIISAILAMTGVLFHRLFQSEQVSTRAAVLEVTTCRLANQFRGDLHSAQEVRLTTSKEGNRPVLELKLEADTAPAVVYTIQSERVLREVHGEAGVTARDVFRLPDCQLSFKEESKSEAGATKFVALLINRPHAVATASPQAEPPLFELAIEGELGRDRRLLSQAQDKGKQSQKGQQ
jgi:prepilin-type N-terminal cleavage/methylation domain-containing protein